MPPRKKPSTKPVNSWNDAGNLMREYAETLEQQQRVMKALAGFFEDKAGSVRGGGKKRKNNTGAAAGKPKKAKSAYLHYVCEEMPKIKASNANLKQKDIMSILGDKWKKMDETHRSPYTQAATESKNQYSLDLGQWEQAQAQLKQDGLLGADDSDDDDDDDSGDSGEKKKKKKKKGEKKSKKNKSRDLEEEQQLPQQPQQPQQIVPSAGP
jgi:hypothetical protein